MDPVDRAELVEVHRLVTWIEAVAAGVTRWRQDQQRGQRSAPRQAGGMNLVDRVELIEGHRLVTWIEAVAARVTRWRQDQP